jgi:hypothetical protein
MRFHVAVDFRSNGGCFPHFSVQRRLFPFQHEPLADPVNRIDMHLQPLGDLSAGHPSSLAASVAPQQYLRVADLLGRCVPIARDCQKSLALLRGEAYRILVWCRNGHPWHS